MVKATTKYTKKALFRFLIFNTIRLLWFRIIFIILELVMFTMGILFVFYSENILELILSIFVITPLFSFFIPIIYLIIFGIIFFHIVIMNKNMFGYVNTYEFSEDEIIITLISLTESKQMKVNYKYFKRVYESKDVFYLYISMWNAISMYKSDVTGEIIMKWQAFIVNKCDITEGSVSDLRELLEKNMPVTQYFVKSE